MSKKNFTMLMPLLAVGISMAIPAMAQAIRVQAPAGTELATGSTITGQSTNFVGQTPAGNLTCTSSLFEGKLTKNQSEIAEGEITKTTFSGCAIGGVAADVSTNASATSPWKDQFHLSWIWGYLQIHIVKETPLEVTVQPQLFGSLTTCHYTGTAVELKGEEGTGNPFKAVGEKQFTLQSGNKEVCGESFTVDGSFAVKSGSNSIRIDE